MPHSSGRKGQAEPLAALVAAAVVAAALTAAVGVWPAATPDATDRNRAATVLPAVLDATRSGGVVRPERVDAAVAAVPAGYRANVTVAVSNQTDASGPVPPRDADIATRVVAVRHERGVLPGRLRVEVWA